MNCKTVNGKCVDKQIKIPIKKSKIPINEKGPFYNNNDQICEELYDFKLYSSNDMTTPITLPPYLFIEYDVEFK